MLVGKALFQSLIDKIVLSLACEEETEMRRERLIVERIDVNVKSRASTVECQELVRRGGIGTECQLIL